jgi:hypothetical protein
MKMIGTTEAFPINKEVNMKLQALKEAEFKSSSLQVIPVMPRRINSLSELPVVSYHFIVDGEVQQVHYNLVPNTQRRQPLIPSNYATIARDMVEAYSELGVQLHPDNRAAWWSDDKEYLAQTMQNMMRQKLRACMNGRHAEGATIHALGHTYVPLDQGASLRIYPPKEPQDMDLDRWDIILKGQVAFFGEKCEFAVHHAHAQGFELWNLVGIMKELEDIILRWFPFAKGHIQFWDIQTLSNPINHQDKHIRA